MPLLGGNIAYHQDIVDEVLSLLPKIKGNEDDASHGTDTNDNSDDGRISNSKIILNFFGPTGSGKTTIAKTICGIIQRPLLSIDLVEILSRGLPMEESLLVGFREALLFGAPYILKILRYC